MKLRYKILLGNITFTILFYVSAMLVGLMFNNSPATDLHDAIGQAVNVILFIILYVFILPIWLIIYIISKVKNNIELANGSILSFTFSLSTILIFYFAYYT